MGRQYWYTVLATITIIETILIGSSLVATQRTVALWEFLDSLVFILAVCIPGIAVGTSVFRLMPLKSKRIGSWIHVISAIASMIGSMVFGVLVGIVYLEHWHFGGTPMVIVLPIITAGLSGFIGLLYGAGLGQRAH